MGIVFDLSRRDLMRSRKTLFALLVSLLPAALAILVVVGTHADFESSSTYYPLLSGGLAFTGLLATIPLVCLILAGGSIADEAEERTLSYLLVRPISRRALFFGRTGAVAATAVALVLVQVASVWLVDLLFYLSADVVDPIHTPTGPMSAGWALMLALPAGVVAGSLAALLYTGMFCAISILFTRYHFFANLVWFLVWEVGIGLSHLPPAWLSGNHALRVLAHLIDPAVPAMSPADGLARLAAIPLSLAYIVLWWWLGARIMERRDFHVTSAVT